MVETTSVARVLEFYQGHEHSYQAEAPPTAALWIRQIEAAINCENSKSKTP
jgi:hypothetical protein